jgi:hypothetical protein
LGQLHVPCGDGAPGPCGPRHHHLVHVDSSLGMSPTGDPLGTCTGKSQTFPEPKKCFSIYESYCTDHFETPRDDLDLIRDSEQTWYRHHEYHISTLAMLSVKCATLLVRESVDMIETHLWSIINSETWMSIMIPTHSTHVFIGSTMMLRIQTILYFIPFVS